VLSWCLTENIYCFFRTRETHCMQQGNLGPTQPGHPSLRRWNDYHLSLGSKQSLWLYRWPLLGPRRQLSPSVVLVLLRRHKSGCFGLLDRPDETCVHTMSRGKMYHFLTLSYPNPSFRIQNSYTAGNNRLQQRPFNSLWSRTTLVGRYQKKQLLWIFMEQGKIMEAEAPTVLAIPLCVGEMITT